MFLLYSAISFLAAKDIPAVGFLSLVLENISKLYIFPFITLLLFNIASKTVFCIKCSPIVWAENTSPATLWKLKYLPKAATLLFSTASSSIFCISSCFNKTSKNLIIAPNLL